MNKRIFLISQAILLSGYGQIYARSREQSADKKLEVLRVDYEHAVRHRDWEKFNSFYEDKFKIQS